VQKVFLKALAAPELLREPRAYIYAALRREVALQAQRLHRNTSGRPSAWLRSGRPPRPAATLAPPSPTAT
jgi:hypothetical protein